MVAAILGLLVMAACAAHYWNLKNQVATFETTIDQGRDESDQLQRDKDQLKVIEEKRDGLVEEAKNAREQASLLKQQLTTATKMLKT